MSSGVFVSDINIVPTEIYSAIGRCLHTWSSVELEVSNLYMALHERRRDEYGHPIRASFETVISLEIRTAMIRAFVAAHPKLENAYLPHVTALCARVMKLYKKRHDVAHFMLVVHAEKEPHYAVIRPFFTMDSFTKQRGAELTVTQIQDRVTSFIEMRTRLIRHIQHVGAVLGLPPEYYVQAGDLAHPSLTTADLPPAEQKPPPLS